MKRGYTVLEYKSIIRRLRAARPDISISSDFIVGFPGETEEDFERTMKLAADIGFDASFSFVYSRRPGTPRPTSPTTRRRRFKLARLQRLQAAISDGAARISAAMVRLGAAHPGRGPVEKNAQELMGRTENNRIVNFAVASRAMRRPGG